MPQPPTPHERLRFLADLAQKEARHLALTDARLFAQPFTEARARSLAQDIDLAERADAGFTCSGKATALGRRSAWVRLLLKIFVSTRSPRDIQSVYPNMNAVEQQGKQKHAIMRVSLSARARVRSSWPSNTSTRI